MLQLTIILSIEQLSTYQIFVLCKHAHVFCMINLQKLGVEKHGFSVKSSWDLNTPVCANYFIKVLMIYFDKLLFLNLSVFLIAYPTGGFSHSVGFESAEKHKFVKDNGEYRHCDNI